MTKARGFDYEQVGSSVNRIGQADVKGFLKIGRLQPSADRRITQAAFETIDRAYSWSDLLRAEEKKGK
jgi:hypothetical protein